MGKPAASISKRSWPQRLNFWRSPSRGGGRGRRNPEDNFSSSSESDSDSSSSGTYGFSFITGDEEEEDASYTEDDMTHGDETKTYQTYDDATYDDDATDEDDEDGDDALQQFVGGVLSKANHSFRSFMTGGTPGQDANSIILSPNGDEHQEHNSDETTLQEFDASTYNEDTIRGALSFGTDRSSKITTTTAEEQLSSSIKLVHEVHEQEDVLDDDEGTNTGCVIFPFDFRKKAYDANQSFASTEAESTFIQLQEKLRETRVEKKMSNDCGTFARDIEEEKTLEEEDIPPAYRNNLIRRLVDDTTDHVLDTIGLLGCVPRGRYESKGQRSPDEDASAFASYYYETGTEGEDNTTYAGHETYPDDVQTYDDYETNVESTMGDSSRLYSSRVDDAKAKNMKSFVGRFYSNATTDESSEGSEMDQSHIYLMMTTARRQRQMQQRKKRGVQNINNVHLMNVTQQQSGQVAKSNFLGGVPFVPDFGMQQNVTAALKVQAKRAIQERWLRELQMAIHEPPDIDRQVAAERVLASWNRHYQHRRRIS